MGGRRAAGLTDADEHPRQGQLPEILGQARSGSGQAPQGNGHRRHAPSGAAIGHPGNGDADGCVEDGEREAEQKAQFGIGQAEVAFDILAEHREDQPIHDAEQLDEEQDDDHSAQIGS